jgi:thiamine-monophosphate kinase
VRVAMELPQPRVALGQALRGVASSAIDVSDGLLGDLAHILQRSAVGATVEVDAVPRSKALASQPLALQRECTLAGGDDYELLFTAAPSQADAVQAAARRSGVAATRIGQINPSRALTLVDAKGHTVPHTFGSFDHFKS